MSECMIKVRTKGSASYSFLTNAGGTNKLRVHAARFLDKDDQTGDERAAATVDRLSKMNPGHQFKVVKA